MQNIVFAAISPHPPIILPTVGSKEDREKVQKTIQNLHKLGEKLKTLEPHSIIISSPHPDWGFNVPLFFLAPEFSGEIKKYLIGSEDPSFYFQKGKDLYKELDQDKKYALIASGDMSHVLKTDGPYGFHPDGPKFDKDFIEALEKKDINKILELDKCYPEAAECGLRSFCFLLGILEAYDKNWEAQVLSYEYPFGVGYLVVHFLLE
ncbi:hypothetical protein J7K24_03110 [bacterium]|nr:hypothetical protein [bacterium]